MAGQAGVCLHTMAMLQVYQADLDMGDKEEVDLQTASGQGSLSLCYKENGQSHWPFNGSPSSYGETSVVESV